MCPAVKYTRGIAALYLESHKLKTAAHAVVVRNAIHTLPAANAGGNEHFVTHTEFLHLHSYLGHLAGNITARDMRHGNFYARQSLSYPDIEMIQCACLHLHKHFIGRNLGKTGIA